MSTHRGVVIRILAGVALATLSGTLPTPAAAETIYFGPTPYLSAADSPFDLSGLGTTFFLEDFEDGELNTPGIRASDMRALQPNFDRDSVDADDGAVDGLGIGGHSAVGGGICTDTEPPNCWWTAAVSFDADELGRFPAAAGIVWTDGWPIDGVAFAMTRPDGSSIANEERYFLGDDNFLGGTAEDRFFGVIDPAGIAGIQLVAGFAPDEPGFSFEVDHLQYGLFIPEPTSLLLLIIGIASIDLGSRNAQPNCLERQRFNAHTQ